MEKLAKDIEYFIKRVFFTVPLLIVSTIAYGYSLGHIAMGIDDLCRARYVAGGYYIQMGRLCGWLVIRLLGANGATVFAQELLGLVFLLAAAVLFCVLFRRASQDKLHPACYTAFACLFVTYPVNAAIWVYADTGFMVKLGYAMVAAALLFVDRSLATKRWIWLLPGALLTAFSISMYETMAVVFLCGTGAMLTLRALFDGERTGQWRRILRAGLVCAVVLVTALLLYVICTRGAQWALGLDSQPFNSQTIGWFSANKTVASRLVVLAQKFLTYYGVASFFFWPLTVLVFSGFLSVGACIVAIIKKRSAAVLALVVLTFSLFALPLAQGFFSFYRTCQSFAPYAAFMFMLLLQAAMSIRFRRIPAAITVVGLVFLAVAQAFNMDNAFYLDDLRYQEEKRMVCAAADSVLEACDNRKPVAFVGRPALRFQTIPLRIVDTTSPLYDYFHGRLEFLPAYLDYRELPTQFLGWCLIAFGEREVEFFRFLNYLGYDGFSRTTDEQYAEAKAIAADMPSYPQSGYIRDAGAFIVVKLGETS